MAPIPAWSGGPAPRPRPAAAVTADLLRTWRYLAAVWTLPATGACTCWFGYFTGPYTIPGDGPAAPGWLWTGSFLASLALPGWWVGQPGSSPAGWPLWAARAPAVVAGWRPG